VATAPGALRCYSAPARPPVDRLCPKLRVALCALCLPACLPAQIYFKVTPSNEILLLWCSSLTVIASKLPGALEPRADSPTADRKAAELEQIRRLPLTLEQVAAYSVARG
jgi:hypothetical protein